LSETEEEVSEIKEISSVISRQTSAPTMMYQAPSAPEEASTFEPVADSDEYPVYAEDDEKEYSYKSEPEETKDDYTDDYKDDYKSDFVDLKSQGKNMFADILKDLDDNQKSSSASYAPPKVEVFGAYSTEN